ncbi:unnamed protein product [Cylindrotheca closterium]|uniref:SAP domain-containing protein n=1 Tax=Cylindrotheca closterium TaxID=2856 RepID=A0AAD2JIA5_9STRA|nr:unnamed protein product [Cylindrotheca closterium]
MRITKIIPLLIVSLCADEVSPFSFFGKHLGKRRRSMIKSSEDTPAFFASAVVEKVVDVSVPYDAAARLAYESSNKTVAFERFKTVYLERAVELVKSKQHGYVPSPVYEPADVSVPYDAAVKLAYETSESRLLFEAYKKIYIEEVVNMVIRKNNERKRQEFAAKFNPKPPISPPPVPPVVDEKLARLIGKFEQSKDVTVAKITDFVKTIEFKKPEVQEGVPEESIKGAALLTAGLALLSTKGVVISGAAGISAAFASMQKGQVGDVFRSFGSVTWDATEAAIQLVRAASADERVTGLSNELAAKVTRAIDQYQSEQMATKKSVYAPKMDDSLATEEIMQSSPELVAEFLEQVEAVIDQADAAMALADETLGKADMKLDDVLMEEDEAETGEEDEDEVATSSNISNVLEDETDELDDDEDAVIDADNILVENDEGTVEEDAEEELAADEDEDEWAATLELAQQGVGGKIVGMDEIIADIGAKADWDAATKLAEELNQVGESEADEEEAPMVFDDDEEDEEEEVTSNSDEEDLDDFMPEGDLEAIASAAREAVAMSSETIVDNEEEATSDSDEDDLDDLIPEGDLEAIARAAREAVAMSGETIADDEVAMSGETIVDDEEEATSDDDEDLDDLMPEGDLEAIARAAREAVAMSGETIVDDEEEATSDSDEEDLDDLMPEGDLEAIARAAREAVAMSGETIVDDEEEATSDSDEEDLDDLMPEGDLEAIARAAREAVAMSGETIVDDEEEATSDSDEEDLDDLMPEGDLEAIARAAREAVAMSGETIVDDEEEATSDSDEEDLDDLMPEGDLEAIARAAREAVAMSGETIVDDEEEATSDSDEEDLDDLMPEGDLEAIARAAREAVAMSSATAVDDDEDDEVFVPSVDSDFDDVEAMLPEGDLEVIARAAREAVAMSGETLVDDDKFSDSDLEAVQDMLPEGDLEEIARAVAMKGKKVIDDNDFEDDDEDVSDMFADQGDLETISSAAKNAIAMSSAPGNSQRSDLPLPLRDWSKLTVSFLREECKVRGIKAYGKKSKLVAKLEQYELEVYESEQTPGVQAAKETSSDDDLDWEFEMDGIDLAEIGKQARAAVQAYEDEHNDVNNDDVLEEGSPAAVQPESTVESEFSVPAVTDFSKLTVIELKDELRKRGLRLSGKKADLIERLQSS